MKIVRSSSLFLTLYILLSIVIVTAQTTCSALIEEALASLDTNCEDLDRNTACYGFDLVQAAFLSDVPDDFFVEPADVAGIGDLETIATAGLDEEHDIWGVAVMNVQANLPNTIPGQNVTFVLMGDTEVENAVSPENAFVPSDGIDVLTVVPAGANVRSGPGTNYNVLGAAANDTTLQADGLSEDREWLRVAFRDRPAWISRTVLEENAAIDDLPVLSPDLHTPMQAFFLRTGIGESTCEAAPDDILLIQGPDNIEIEFTVNGANVNIGSSVGLRVVLINGEEFLELMVFDGKAEVGGVTVYPGYRTLMCLDEPDNRGVDGQANDRLVSCDPTPPEPVEDFGEQWCILEEIPASLLNYSIEILCPGETPPPTTSGGGGAASQSQITDVNCSNFGLIGPFSGITPRPTTFSWTEAPGATDYEVVFYNFQGGVAQTFFTKETSIILNVGEIPTGSELAWEVRAYRDGAYACVTSRTPTIFRNADPNPPQQQQAPSTAGFSTYKVCSGMDVAYVYWSNATGNVVISWEDNLGSVFGSPQSGSPPSGSATVMSSYSFYNLTVIDVTHNGTTYNLGGC